MPFPLGGYTLFSVTLPNIVAIPLWVVQVFAWAIGWPLAYIQWMIEAAAVYLSMPVVWIVNILGSIWTWLLDAITSISSQTGPFEPVVAAFLFGIVLMILILGVYGIVKIVEFLGGLIS